MKTMGIQRGAVWRLGLVCALAAGPVHAQANQGSPAVVAVNNTGDVPVVVFMVREPLHLRLGTVAARARGTLALPGDVPRGEVVRIFAHPEGGGYLPSREFRVEPGARLVLDVHPGAASSRTPPALQPLSVVGQGSTTVTLRNETDGTVTLYVEQGEFDVRIGSVPANQEQTLRLPVTLVRGQEFLVLFVHLEHGPDLPAREHEVRVGQNLFLRVPAQRR